MVPAKCTARDHTRMRAHALPYIRGRTDARTHARRPALSYTHAHTHDLVGGRPRSEKGLEARASWRFPLFRPQDSRTAALTQLPGRLPPRRRRFLPAPDWPQVRLATGMLNSWRRFRQNGALAPGRPRRHPRPRISSGARWPGVCLVSGGEASGGHAAPPHRRRHSLEPAVLKTPLAWFVCQLTFKWLLPVEQNSYLHSQLHTDTHVCVRTRGKHELEEGV